MLISGATSDDDDQWCYLSSVQKCFPVQQETLLEYVALYKATWFAVCEVKAFAEF